ncbi:MAG: efflux RND transporter permease subunit [Planctomycetota bacterium]|jgi:predicted RND superfamily exporter protein
MLHNPSNPTPSESPEFDPKQVSFTAKLFASVIDYPKLCLTLLVLLTGLAIGGYLDPDWPEKLRSRWFPNSDNSAIASGEFSPQANTTNSGNSQGPRRFGRRGGFGNSGGRAEAVLVVKSPSIFTPEGSQAFRAVVDRVDALDVVASVRSLDQAPPLNIFGLSEPILPRGNATQQRFDVAKKKAVSHPLVVGQMLSDDAQTALIEIQYDWLYIQENADCTKPILAAAKAVAAEHPNVPLEFHVTGNVPLRMELMQNNRNNEYRYQAIGYSMILLMAAILFRGLSVVLVVAAAPVIGVFWTLGFLRYFDLQENPFSFVILPVLLSLVGFTDGVHIMIHIRKCMREGLAPKAACKRTLELVGLACFLTSLTTAIGMGSLAWANHQIVREFGWSCVLGVTATWISVMLVIPLISMTPWSKRLSKGTERDLLHHLIDRFEPTIGWIIDRKRAFSYFAILLTLGLGCLALALRPDDRKSSAFPTGSDAQRSLAHLDQAMNGLDVCMIDVKWDSTKLSKDQVATALDQVETVLKNEPLIGHPLSLVTLLNALPGEGTVLDKLSMAELLPPPLRQRLFNEEQSTATMTYRCKDLGTATYQSTFQRIDQSLESIVAQNPGLSMEMQGEAIWRWKNLYTIVTDLTASLGSAALIIFAVLAIAYRSLRLGLIAIIPNVLPLLASAAYMVITKQPLEVVSVCCFTICLGIAVDDTIHFMSRYLEEFKNGGSHASVIQRSFREVGTGMMMTTIVLVAGFSSVLTSDTRDHRVFGALGVITLVTALLCDMFLLPAMLAYFDNARKRIAEPLATESNVR